MVPDQFQHTSSNAKQYTSPLRNPTISSHEALVSHHPIRHPLSRSRATDVSDQ